MTTTRTRWAQRMRAGGLLLLWTLPTLSACTSDAAVKAQPVAPATASAPAQVIAAATGPAADRPAPTGTVSDTNRADVVLQREQFSYSGGGRRDPYRSLMTSRDVRPLISDLRVAVIVYDPADDQSVAILRDAFSHRQYRVRVGQQVGRLRVSAIKPKAVMFTIEEFGFNRTETLPLSSDSTKVRTP